MNPPLPTRANAVTRRSTSGLVLVEYLVIAAVLAVVLFAGNPSPAEKCLAAFRIAYAKYTYSISIP